ncbi:MAG: LysM peptidoglycan-binding domain-containing protein [Opitutaceae bacterium]|nr:LysM peptidoglycan-binding domain-containing protein [Opitutaceae bacterium]
MTFRSAFWLRVLPFAVVVACAAAPALRAQDLNAVIAGLREDIRILDERTRQLTVEVEQLKRENSGLRAQGDANYVTMAQMTAALADLERALRAGDKELAIQLTQQMERLAKQTNAALDALAKGSARSTAPAVQFTPLPANTPGTTYEVQPGDTLASIATRFGSTVKDIQNANKIADPTKLQVGQTLFIPQR